MSDDWMERTDHARKSDRGRLKIHHPEPMRSLLYIGGKNGIEILSPAPVPGWWNRTMQRLLLGFTWEKYKP